MGRFKFNFDLESIESYVSNHLRLFISLSIGLIVFVGIIAVTVFFIAVRGAEQTMVPDVQGKELTQALLELQVKELYPRIQLRYSQSAYDKGTILEQDPPAGTIVKAGRRIRLVVSEGTMISNVDNYIGRDISEVRMDLQTIFASAIQPLLSLKEPFMYEYSSEPAGTILQQSPEPGTDISGPTPLEFVVSRGPENVMVTVPTLIGLPISDALDLIRQSSLTFKFSSRAVRNQERPETVVWQIPEAQAMVESNAEIEVIVSEPETLAPGEVFAVFLYKMEENPYPMTVRLEAVLPSGERRHLATLEHRGGELTVPYKLPAASTLILYLSNREIFREEVQIPLPEQYSFEQLSPAGN